MSVYDALSGGETYADTGKFFLAMETLEGLKQFSCMRRIEPGPVVDDTKKSLRFFLLCKNPDIRQVAT